MASIFFPLGPAKTPNIVNLVDASLQTLASEPGFKACAGGSADRFLGQTPSETGPPAIIMQTLSALGAGGWTRTPTTFVTGT
jgi:hypothetical protein